MAVPRGAPYRRTTYWPPSFARSPRLCVVSGSSRVTTLQTCWWEPRQEVAWLGLGSGLGLGLGLGLGSGFGLSATMVISSTSASLSAGPGGPTW